MWDSSSTWKRLDWKFQNQQRHAHKIPRRTIVIPVTQALSIDLLPTELSLRSFPLPFLPFAPITNKYTSFSQI
ncbi:hypothetical protein VNO78_10071 [Psophocarpus tetragonolobus]|uniref:Uncharacterized protein n=1 Tax=Psophocarpus tetragonolobus TaxID=3891 RepID=A0AAN9SKK8_PSOTE